MEWRSGRPLRQRTRRTTAPLLGRELAVDRRRHRPGARRPRRLAVLAEVEAECGRAGRGELRRHARTAEQEQQGRGRRRRPTTCVRCIRSRPMPTSRTSRSRASPWTRATSKRQQAAAHRRGQLARSRVAVDCAVRGSRACSRSKASTTTRSSCSTSPRPAPSPRCSMTCAATCSQRRATWRLPARTTTRRSPPRRRPASRVLDREFVELKRDALPAAATVAAATPAPAAEPACRGCQAMKRAPGAHRSGLRGEPAGARRGVRQGQETSSRRPN